MSLHNRLNQSNVLDNVEYVLHPGNRFAVSRCGKVMGRTGRQLKPKSQGKYLIVSYQAETKQIRHCYVHRLVAETFLESKGLPTVNHINGNRNDNRVTNLEWCSYAHNTAHAVSSGLLRNLPAKGQRGFQCLA